MWLVLGCSPLSGPWTSFQSTLPLSPKWSHQWSILQGRALCGLVFMQNWSGSCWFSLMPSFGTPIFRSLGGMLSWYSFQNRALENSGRSPLLHDYIRFLSAWHRGEFSSSLSNWSGYPGTSLASGRVSRHWIVWVPWFTSVLPQVLVQLPDLRVPRRILNVVLLLTSKRYLHFSSPTE